MSGIPKNGKPAPEPQGVQVVAPTPVPFTFQADLVMNSGQPLVQLRFFTPSGATILFVAPDAARQIANIIQDKAGGLVVASPEVKGIG